MDGELKTVLKSKEMASGEMTAALLSSIKLVPSAQKLPNPYCGSEVFVHPQNWRETYSPQLTRDQTEAWHTWD